MALDCVVEPYSFCSKLFQGFSKAMCVAESFYLLLLLSQSLTKYFLLLINGRVAK